MLVTPSLSCRQAEVADLHVVHGELVLAVLVGDEHVLWLQVPVDDVLPVQEADAVHQLPEPHAGR